MNTDELKQTLAEMLGDAAYFEGGTLYYAGDAVAKTELLYFCALVEEGLTEDQRPFYYAGLKNLCSLEGVHPFSALWHQRVRVLANTKGLTP